MAKLFVNFKTKAAFIAAVKGTDYAVNSIVFIQDTQEIWTHDTFYSIPDSYKTKITNLETAVAALQAAQAANFAVREVSDGTNTFKAAAGKESITVKAGANTSVAVNANGELTIGSTLTPTSYYPNASGETLSAKVTALENAQYTVEGSDVIEVTSVDETKTIDLKVDNSGTVTLTKGANGLKADVASVDTLVPVNGVKAGDKVLKVEGKKISATVSLSVDATAGSDGKKYIRLTGVDGADLGKIDTAEFVKDGMLEDAKFNTASKILTLTFNTVSGKEAIEVPLESLVDIYDGSNLKLKSITIPDNSSEPAAGDSVDSAVANLIAKDRELNTEITNVKKNIQDLTAGGLSGIDKGTEGKHVTVSISEKANNRQSVGVSVTTKEVSKATSAADGLATAYDVQTYVAAQIADALSWAEFN